MNDTGVQVLAQWIRCAFPLEASALPPTRPRAPDWGTLAQAAEENAVAPLLYAALKQLGCADELPAPFAERLRIQYLRADTANWVALRELLELENDFARAQIPAVVLKGGALAPTLYPDPALRPMSDLDILIPRPQFAAADSVLCSKLYSSPLELSDDFAPRLTNYRAYVRGGKRPAHVELHWHLFKSPYYWRRVPIEWFWARTTEIKIQNQPVRVLAPEAQLLHLAAHFSLHHRAERLIWSYDLARLIARDRDSLNWEELMDAAHQFGLAPAVRLALTRVAQTWGVCAPNAALERLNAARPDWRDRAAFSLMTAPRGEPRFLLDTIGLPGVRAKLQFLWYHLFPSRAYMRARYPARTNTAVFWLYWGRLGGGVHHFFRTLASMIASG